jgi:phosphoglycolate phosphatase-like HAD superfamily hydrolase
MHVLFDLDGTLTNPKEGFVKYIRHALAKLAHDLGCNTLELTPQTAMPDYS